MRQKGWTLFTLIMVEDVAASMETPDDKRLKRLRLTLKTYAREFINRLASSSADLGMELK